MIQELVTKRSLHDASSNKHDLAYWLSKTPEERVAAVDYLRWQIHGSKVRLQKTVRVVKRAKARKKT